MRAGDHLADVVTLLQRPLRHAWNGLAVLQDACCVTDHENSGPERRLQVGTDEGAPGSVRLRSNLRREARGGDARQPR